MIIAVPLSLLTAKKKTNRERGRESGSGFDAVVLGKGLKRGGKRGRGRERGWLVVLRGKEKEKKKRN